MRWQASVLARKDAAIICHKLPKEVDVFVVERIHGEIDFGLRTGSTPFDRSAFAAALLIIPFVCMGLARHNLFDFAVQSVAAKRRIVFLDFQFFGLEFFVAGGRVARGAFAFLASLGAFDGDNFAGHKLILFPSRAFLQLPSLLLRSRPLRRCQLCLECRAGADAARLRVRAGPALLP